MHRSCVELGMLAVEATLAPVLLGQAQTKFLTGRYRRKTGIDFPRMKIV
jgi:hypothetical protein